MTAKVPQFFKKVQQGGKTYELYLGDDPEAARAWLLKKKVDKPLSYIQVKTEQGVWGIDVEGLFLTDLLPWQTNMSLAEHEGATVGIPSPFNLATAAQGRQDNFVIEVQCGNQECVFTWMDAIRYQNKTVVRCPKCRKYSLIDSSHIRSM